MENKIINKEDSKKFIEDLQKRGIVLLQNYFKQIEIINKLIGERYGK